MSAAGPLLTVDLGNTSCGLRLGTGEHARPLPRLDPRSPAFAKALAETLAPLDPSGAAVYSSVAAPAVEALLAAGLRAHFGERVGTPDCGLEILCRDVHTIGADRLFAARGAVEVLGRSAIVVDAGTALTVDAVEVAGGGRGRFHGGAIAPGPALLARALADAAKLHEIEPRPGTPALGIDTPGALRSGVSVGFRGAARELVLRIGEESGLGHGTIALCGGAAEFLLGPPLFPADAQVHLLPDLVHAGLAAAAAGERT